MLTILREEENGAFRELDAVALRIGRQPLEAVPDYFPFRVRVDAQHSVVVEEAQQCECRERPYSLGGHRPDGRGHRIEITIDEQRGTAALFNYVTWRRRRRGRILDKLGSFPVETQDLPKKAVLSGSENVARCDRCER